MRAIARFTRMQQEREEEIKKKIEAEERRIRLMNQEHDEDFNDYSEVSIEDITQGFIFDHSTNHAEPVHK